MNKHSLLILIFYAFSISLLVLLLIFFHFRGVIYYDEGYILNSGLLTAHGKVPYRDYDMAYTPISFLTTAVFFKIFGESVFTGRLVALAVSILSLFALYKILTLITKNKLLIALCLLFFLGWGPAHINFPSPIMFAAGFLLYMILFYLQGIHSDRQIYFYLAGIMAVLSFFAKQNFGTALIFASLLYFLVFEKGKNKLRIKYFLIGIVSAFFIAFLAFLSTSSLLPFIQNLYLYTFKRILVEKSLDTPFLFYGPLVTKSAKLIFYLSPLFFSLILIYTSKKTKKNYSLIGLLIAAFYLVGIRPTTDYIHLVPLLAVSGLCLVGIIQSVKNVFITRLSLLVLVLLTLLGFYTAYFYGYYKWETPLRFQTYFAKHSRLRLFLSKNTIMLSEQLINYVDNHTKPGEYIFMNYYAPLVYFITNHDNATRYNSIMQLSPSDQKDAILNLQKKKVRLVILHTSTLNEKSSISAYIKKNYHREQSIGDFIVYLKNL